MSQGKEAIQAYLAKHQQLRLATVCPDGQPLVHTMGYACQGTTLYLASFGRTRKVRNILQNPKVAYTVDDDQSDVSRLMGLQFKGRARVLDGPGEREEARRLLEGRFPGLSEQAGETELVFIRLDPSELNVIDHSRGFGQLERVELG